MAAKVDLPHSRDLHSLPHLFLVVWRMILLCETSGR